MGHAAGGSTRELARFVVRTRVGDVPGGLLHQMKLYLLDAIAAGVVGRDLAWTRIARAVAAHRGGAPESVALGLPHKVPTPSATWVNGMAIGGFELDHGAHQAHPASTVLPAALAVADVRGSSGTELLLALTLGYEVACRVGAAGTRAIEDQRSFHNPGTNGPFGAAAVAAKLLGLDEEATVNAFGIAGSSAGGLTEFLSDGSMTKRLHLAAAARGGLEAAELAAQGFTGPGTVLEGPHGFLAAFSPAPRPDLLVEGLGSAYLCDHQVIKAYPAHGTLQGLVAHMTRFRQTNPTSIEDIDRIHLRIGQGHRLLESRFHIAAPRTIVEAQYSLPFCVAVALVRDLRDPAQFDDHVLCEPSVRRLARVVSWEVVDSPTVEVEIRARGRTRSGEVTAVPGSGSDREGFVDVVSKFNVHTAPVLPEDRRQEIVALVSEFDSLPRASTLLDTVNEGILGSRG